MLKKIIPKAQQIKYLLANRNFVSVKTAILLLSPQVARCADVLSSYVICILLLLLVVIIYILRMMTTHQRIGLPVIITGKERPTCRVRIKRGYGCGTERIEGADMRIKRGEDVIFHLI